MKFNELALGEAFAVDDSDLVSRQILKKVGGQLAMDDQGQQTGIEPEREVLPLATASLTHAAWVQQEGEWKLVLRWTEPRERDPQWTSVKPESYELVPYEQGFADRRTRAQLASGFHSQGDVEAALEIYDELITDRPDASLLNNRGAARAAQGNLDGAIADYTRAIGLDATLAQAYSNRGNALTKQGKYAAAISDYDHAIELASDLAPIYCNRGLTRKLLGDLSGSLEDFELAIAADAEFSPGYLARGGVRALIQDVDGAITDLERFLELSPTAPQREQVRAALQRLRGARTR